MPKKTKKPRLDVMSLAMDRDLQLRLAKKARENNVSRSELIRDLVKSYVLDSKKITVIEHDSDHIPIVLKIPKEFQGNIDELRKWLEIKMEGLILRLS